MRPRLAPDETLYRFRKDRYVTATARVKEDRRIGILITLANGEGIKPVIRVPVDTRRKS